MDEKKEIEKKPEGTVPGVDEGGEPKTTTLVEQANEAAERLEKANEERARLLRESAELEAKKVLGGESDAGQQPEKKEETDKEYRDRIEKEVSEGKHND